MFITNQSIFNKEDKGIFKCESEELKDYLIFNGVYPLGGYSYDSNEKLYWNFLKSNKLTQLLKSYKNN